MKKKTIYRTPGWFTLLLTMTLIAGACKDRFVPKLPNVLLGYLVVEGNINTNDTTLIRLSRTSTVDSPVVIPEESATVQIESEDNASYPLVNLGDGTYQTPNLNLQTGMKYCIDIKTSDGKEYRSDLETAIATPAIDSVNWVRDANGVSIYVNTHDPANNTRYYLWDYTETWQIHMPYIDAYQYDSSYNAQTQRYEFNSISPRDVPITDQQECWTNQASTRLLLGNSTKLSSDIIQADYLLLVPSAAEKMAVRYSILVRQYALTADAWEFLDRMRKNTETTGSIFDPQPAALTGNIHNIADASEPVIGFVNVSSLQQQRIFIDHTQLPNWGFERECASDTFPTPDNIPTINAAHDMGIVPLDFDRATNQWFGTGVTCVYCTLYGTNVKPWFWQP